MLLLTFVSCPWTTTYAQFRSFLTSQSSTRDLFVSKSSRSSNQLRISSLGPLDTPASYCRFLGISHSNGRSTSVDWRIPYGQKPKFRLFRTRLTTILQHWRPNKLRGSRNRISRDVPSHPKKPAVDFFMTWRNFRRHSFLPHWLNSSVDLLRLETMECELQGSYPFPWPSHLLFHLHSWTLWWFHVPMCPWAWRVSGWLLRILSHICPSKLYVWALKMLKKVNCSDLID